MAGARIASTGNGAHTAASERFDIIIVGASFAGLACAGVAAARGLHVLVLERDPVPGGVVRTTGILFSDVLDVMDVPQQFLMNAVRRLSVRATGSDATAVIESPAYRFYMADVTGMLQWMAGQAEAHGAVVRCGAMFHDAERLSNGDMRITYLTGGGTGAEPERVEVHARMLVGADGARSRVAQLMGLDRNERLLAGAEWLVEGVDLPNRETFYLIMDAELAPGYCLWLAPHDDIVALGVAGRQREFKPNESLRQAQAMFRNVADLSGMRIRERKGGNIPVGGRYKRVYRDDERGYALLLGDAAGLCGAATGGGIYPALISGRLAGQAIAQELLNGVRGGVQTYLRVLPQAGRLGPYLQIEDWIRLALDRMTTNADMQALVSIFASESGNRALRSILLETPIVGMDNAFAGLARGLLTAHPKLYGAAFRAAWRRVSSRA
ncbi:MAG TPA: NAD(P)/FAD-dependent oxidoreductase [Ktedonobacterales bacterium]